MIGDVMRYNIFKSKMIWFSLLIVIMSLVFNLASIKNILIDVYLWHAVQPETLQGGLELICFFIIILTSFLFCNRSKLINFIPVLAVVIYLQLHQVLLPATVALIYFEIIISIGFFIGKLFKSNLSPSSLNSYLLAFLMGFVTWSCFAILISAMGFGTINDLRILTVVLGLISIVKLNTPLTLYIYKKVTSLNRYNKVGVAFSITLILTQFAKTNRALDYDSLWYGLRPEQVLIGSNSFFDNLGMTMVVHYYPKLFELFALPVSDLNDYSFILSINVLFYVLLLLVIYKFCFVITNNINSSMFATILLGSTPAIANMASTAKTDIFSALFIVSTGYCLWLWIRDRDLLNAVVAISSALLAFGGKITSLMYIPLLYLGYALVYLVNLRGNRKTRFIESKANKNLSVYLLVSSIIVFLGIYYRTFKLTGYPIHAVLGKLWSKLGFVSKYPFAGAPDDFILSDDKEIFKHWIKILFSPEGYTHYIMVWPSNLYLYIWIISIIILIVFRKRLVTSNKLLLVAFIPIFISGVYNIFSFPQGGDGNYYIPVIVFTLISFFGLIKDFSKKFKKVIIICLILFIPTQTYIMMVSHFSWSWGTSKFSADLTKNNIESYDQKIQLFKQEGVYEIEEELAKQPSTSNCIGLLEYDGQEQILNQLSCRFEDIPHMNSRYGNSSLFSSVDAFKEYLMWANVKYIIMPKSSVEGFEYVKKVISELEQSPNTIRLEATKFYLLEINSNDIPSVQGKISSSLDDAILTKGWYSKEANYRWISNEATGVFKSGELGRFTLNGVVPDELEEVQLSILVDDLEVKTWSLSKGDFTIQLNDIPNNSEVNITLRVNKSFIPKQIGINEDTRELSIVIKELFLE